ncbi:hypothetical protein NLJ89_g4030 [Agrocybe chaxingu]|uniref:GAR domain-containing protein n=1 Tax=Agrocybe chaxingu TaxID=84603 RepID=A0A9W8K3M6_9AGAR|nr:hypothetical protein NLJ89_g4030 [Agrocybe chaxingu]
MLETPTHSPSVRDQAPQALPVITPPRRYPAIVHAAVFSAVLAPIVLLPYLGARRKIGALHRTLGRLEKETAKLRRELKLTASAHEATNAELRRLQDLARGTATELGEARKKAVKREAEQLVVDKAMQSGIQKLLADTQYSRTQAASLRALGTSLADIAAFMEEVELDFGMGVRRKDQRGIERLRLLALRMQSLSQLDGEECGKEDAPTPRVEATQQPPSDPSESSEGSPAGEEQALESHEVIELQTFSERKAWIEEKIKFLEALPPIEVFVGLDAIRVSAEEVPGLPSRAELQQMVAEHDAIEKETEIFDTGELKKLRQLTKAATQRNLSPEDTDVIELTLTTIYALDKLLHLLRDRSDHLEMMSIRLTWEENRQSGWKERRQIISDLHTFSVNRARWNSSIYDLSKSEEPAGPTRRGSIASQTSASSDNAVTSPAFSRSARFKLAELLSRDAAQFSGRVTALKHGIVTAAGKALDKLIDHSRRPVPEELLDEQDHFEEKCINELETIGKFTMSLVMQWRKADEIYVETMKDHVTASNLLEEIETAKLYHPTARQSTSFTSRIDTILKRLAVRGDPASPVSLFPRPEHPLFPDQKASNDGLVKMLSADLAAAHQLARKVERAAKEYKTRHEVVKRVETLLVSVQELSTTLISINKKFTDGTVNDDEDGSPPDLVSERSLEPTSHSLYLALLPALLEETAPAVAEAEKLLRISPSALLGLDLPGVDHEFKENAAAAVQRLDALVEDTITARDAITQKVSRLRESRKIASNIASTLETLASIRSEIMSSMELARWRQESIGSNGAPPTPESPASELFSSNLLEADFEAQLGAVSSRIKNDINDPLSKLCTALEPPMQNRLRQKASVLQGGLDSSYQMLALLGSIKGQSSAMSGVRDDFHRLLVRMEDSKIRINAAIEDALASEPGAGILIDSSMKIDSEELNAIQQEVSSFVDELPSRVPFVARTTTLKSPLSPSHFRTKSVDSDIGPEAPFDLASLDASVRADSNSYAMRLNGGLHNLLLSKAHFDLAMTAKEADNLLFLTSNETTAVVQELSGHKASFSQADWRPLSQSVLKSPVLYLPFEIYFVAWMPIRKLFRHLTATQDMADETEIFKNEISHAIADECKYQEKLRAAEEKRRQEEEARLAAEEAERLRLEQEKIENQERQRLLEEKLAEERRLELERQRIAAELAEEERLEREAAEAERLRLEEEQRRLEAARLQAELERQAKEDAEKTRQEQERLEILEKLSLAEARLEEERQIHAENERIASKLARKQRLKMEELARRQAEMERLEQERLRQEELTRLKLEQERLEQEEREERELEERQQREQEESERMAREAREKEREEREVRERREKEMKERAEKEAREEEEFAKAKAEQERKEVEARALREQEERQRQDRERQEQVQNLSEDVFGVQASVSRAPLSEEMKKLQAEILALRKRLRSICISEALRPTKSSTDLPTAKEQEEMSRSLSIVSTNTQKLPTNVEDLNLNAELHSLRTEVKESFGLLKELQKLVDFQKAIQDCDAALSDLLEHIDSYPAIPLGVLSSTHTSSQTALPEEQMAARVRFTGDLVEAVGLKLTAVSNDRRAISEHSRIQQTWSELHEMATDRIGGKKSRPPSVVSRNSSGRNSSASTNASAANGANAHGARKVGLYSHLSVSSVPSPARGKTLAAPLKQDSRRSLAPRTSINSSTWSRAPRDSFSSILPRLMTPQSRKTSNPPPRKKYVADPKSKLDVAVGDVVNQLPVGINVEGITESWRDQSGKYWIGNQDPKLCFCRILRSQTVMVRVGGGWQELSKFIKNHFAESFRIAPESPPRLGAQEEKWISSATLLGVQESGSSPPAPPRTPEPTVPFVPTFSFMSPGGLSPQSLKSGSSPSAKGSSPLTPLQFIRRAEPDLSLLRPPTPSKTPSRSHLSNTPIRAPAWRP